MTGRRTMLGVAGSLAFAAAMTLSIAGVAQAAPKTMTIKGFNAPGTPSELNKVKVVKQGPRKAKRILVLVPGTSAGATNFSPLGEGLLARLNRNQKRKWAVWSIERRENLLEDHSYLKKYMAGDVTAKEMFDYYLGWILDGSISPHFTPKTTAETQYAKQWGMNVAVRDIRKVVRVANRRGRKVVLGGHSLGGSITTAYATWDFNGKAGSKDLDGLVFIDGAGGGLDSSQLPTTEAAQKNLDNLNTAGTSPFITLVPPFPWAAGVFNATGSSTAILEPDVASAVQSSPIIPPFLKPPVPATNLAQYGYAVDNDTGPESLKLVQSHIGRLADSGDPRGWVNGELGTARRAARVFAEKDGMDGTSWYHPTRLSIDSAAINNGVANPAQSVYGVKATKGRSVKLPMYSFDTSLGDGRVAKATWSLAEQSHVPARWVRTVQKTGTYSHIDPLSALPKKNAFINTLVPFLKKHVK